VAPGSDGQPSAAAQPPELLPFRGEQHGVVCADKHGAHKVLPATLPTMLLNGRMCYDSQAHGVREPRGGKGSFRCAQRITLSRMSRCYVAVRGGDASMIDEETRR
jgi:hypothetical protein